MNYKIIKKNCNNLKDNLGNQILHFEKLIKYYSIKENRFEIF